MLESPKPTAGTRVTLLGRPEPLQWSPADGKLKIQVPNFSVDEVPCAHAYVFKLTGVE